VSLLEIEGLQVHHRGKQIVAGVDLSIEPGEALGLAGEVELYTYRPAFEADPRKVEPLVGAITRAHRALVGSTPTHAPPPFSSMWRDINCFNEMRIPAVTYGPGVSVGAGTFGMKVDDLVIGAKLYALTALDLCSQDRV